MSKALRTTYTVFGVEEADMEQRVFLHVEATSSQEAEKKAREQHAITIAGVVIGKVYPAKEGVPGVTSIRARGFKTKVSEVKIRHRSVTLPLRCPGCKANLRGKNTLYQWNLRPFVCTGRLPPGSFDSKGNMGILLGIDTAPLDEADIQAAVIRCTRCNHLLWDGLKKEEA